MNVENTFNVFQFDVRSSLCVCLFRFGHSKYPIAWKKPSHNFYAMYQMYTYAPVRESNLLVKAMKCK